MTGLGLAAVSLLLLSGLALGLPQPMPGQFGIGYGPALHMFVVIACLQAVIYFIAVAVQRHAGPETLPLILGAAIVFRLTLLMFPPFLSNDMYRYIWDGWVQLAGINPYRYIPADPHLAFLRDGAVYPNINRATYAPTIYPPAAELFFLAAAGATRALALPPVIGMKLALLVMEGIGIFALLRVLRRAGLPRTNILIYAWNPLPIWEFASSGHVDALTICFISLAFLAASAARSGFAASALAAAVLTKFLPLLLFPALWRRGDWRFVFVFTAVIVLLYAPYIGAGKAVLGFLGGYAAQENIESGRGLLLLELLPFIPAPLYLGSLGVTLAGLAGFLVFRRAGPNSQPERIAARALILGGALMLGLSPHFPWYYPWLLIPACIVPAKSALYLVSAAFVLYLNPSHTMLFWPAIVFFPFAALAIADLWRNRAAAFGAGANP